MNSQSYWDVEGQTLEILWRGVAMSMQASQTRPTDWMKSDLKGNSTLGLQLERWMLVRTMSSRGPRKSENFLFLAFQRQDLAVADEFECNFSQLFYVRV